MAEAGRGSTHPATAPSQLFHKEKMLAGTWHPSETLRAARGEQKSTAGPQESPQSSQDQPAPGWVLRAAEGLEQSRAEQMAAIWP